MDFNPAAQKVAIYTRISTDKQTPESQLSELRAYCARRGWTNVEEITDVVSGAKSSREGLDRLMLAVRRGKVDVVVCFKLDRLGRSLAHLAQIIGEFAAHNVALVVPSQAIDTSASNSAARLQLNVLCAVAEFEREVIRERVNAGLAVAKAKGVRLGRPPAHDIQRAEVARLRSEGMSYRAISKQLGLPVSSVFELNARSS
jgi:DNA invertase Pin-like site-specific DNA recombinase